jgi:hypothetical protein
MGEHHILAPQASLPVSKPAAAELLQAARAVHPTVWRFAVRRDWPQLELQIPLPDPKQCAAPQFFASLRSLAQQMAEHP